MEYSFINDPKLKEKLEKARKKTKKKEFRQKKFRNQFK